MNFMDSQGLGPLGRKLRTKVKRSNEPKMPASAPIISLRELLRAQLEPLKAKSECMGIPKELRTTRTAKEFEIKLTAHRI